MMNSIERVNNAALRMPADRPATDLRLTPEASLALRNYFNAGSDIEVLDILDIDIRWVYLPYIGPLDRNTPPLCGTGRDFWGVEWQDVKNDFNTYYEIARSPMADFTSVREVEDYEWPDLDWWDYEAINNHIDAHCEKAPRSILFFAGGAFETPWYIRGMERFFMDLYENPEIVDAICSKVEEYYRLRALRVIEAAEGRINIIGSGGDVGGQNGMMINPHIWREKIKPYSGKLISTFKEMGFLTFYHSCGSCVPVIDDLVECGLDFLDPIQVTAKGMTPEELFPRFGDKLSFHGAIDEVELLPHSTAREIYDETLRIIGILGKNNGYVVAPSHQVQGDTAPENIIAIYDAVKSIKKKQDLYGG